MDASLKTKEPNVKYIEQSHLDGKWYVMDPDESKSFGPFESKEKAKLFMRADLYGSETAAAMRVLAMMKNKE